MSYRGLTTVSRKAVQGVHFLIFLLDTVVKPRYDTEVHNEFY
ncbi:MAG: palindromic element RPE4 domain-containing protein [Rickettsia sp.]